MKRRACLCLVCVVLKFAATAAAAPMYHLTTLANFNGANGAFPYAGLLADADGNLYGTTQRGGANNAGTVFELAAATHTLSTLATFNGTNGANPNYGALISDADGNLYGTTLGGGANGQGTVFEVAAGTHALTTLVSFNGTNGWQPESGLVADASGNLFGTTRYGGPGGNGTVFELAAGTHELTTLASFNFNTTDGRNPVAGLIADASGNLYGTTGGGGANNGHGTVFELAVGTHTITTLASFNGTNGNDPQAVLIADASGNLYGTTEIGGANNDGTVFEVANDVNHTLTTLVSFNTTNGANPRGDLIADVSGNLYGTTGGGGDLTLNFGLGVGTVFELAAGTHTLTTLVTFNYTNGADPFAGLIADASGNLYGTTAGGGANNRGTVFELSPVPEPSTFVLAALGVFGLVMSRRMKELMKSPTRLNNRNAAHIIRFTRRLIMALALAACVTLQPADAATVRTVALSGQQAPGTPSGVDFLLNPAGNARPPVLNDAGQTAFPASLTGSGVDGTNNDGIWSEGSGSLALVARSGDHVPGTPNGVNYSPFSNTNLPLVLNDAGQTALYVTLVGTGVDSTNNQGIWSEGSGSLALVARSGSQAPGTPSGANFSSLREPVLNNAGRTAFSATLTGGGVDSTNNRGIWSEGSGSLTLVARLGSQAPGTPSGVNYSSFSPHVLNDVGQTAFVASLTGSGVDSTNNQGIWSEGAGSLALVVRRGSQATGTPAGVNYSSLGVPVLNNAGKTAFSATLTGGGVDSTNNKGIWSEGSGSLTLVARSGSQAPGTPSGVNYCGFGTTGHTLNDAGQTAFQAFLTGSGVDVTNFEGIWATVRTGALQLIVRTGEPLEVAPGEFRTISGLRLTSNTGNSDGRPSGFNNLGQLAFGADFTDGSSGVFVSNLVAIPEPSTLLLLCFGSLAVLWRRRGLVCAAILAAGVGATVVDSAEADTVRTVALSGQQAPGTASGVNYRSFLNYPVLNDAGQTAFTAVLTGSGVNSTNIVGIWSEGSGNLALVARAGSQAPGTASGLNYSAFPGSPVLNEAGQIAFQAMLADSSRGIWSERSGSLALVARGGSQAPGMASGVNFGGPFDLLVLNNAGQTAFKAGLTGSGVDFTNSGGIWSEGSGSLSLVARAGSQAPGAPNGVNYSGFASSYSYPVLNDAGQTAFNAQLTDGSAGIWSEGSGSLALVARSGSQAPGTPSGVNYDQRLFFLSPVLNNAGQTAFIAALTGSGVDDTNNEGIWSEGSGNLTLVARTGRQAPGAPNGVNFGPYYLGDPVLNDAGQTAFFDTLTNGSQGFWLEGSGSLALVAPSTIDTLALNNTGQVAFGFRGVIWATDRTGTLQLIARNGDPLEVAPGDFRTISGLRFVEQSTGNSDGRPSGFNNLGQVAFSATFTDGTSGVFVSNLVAVPEPSTISAMLICTLCFAFHRPRNTQ